MSRGIDTTLIVLGCGVDVEDACTTSERWPPTLPAPVTSASRPVRPARESEPIARTLNGLPGTSGSQTLWTVPHSGFSEASCT